MSNTELLIKEIQNLPAGFVDEVLDYIGRLKRENGSAKTASQKLPPAYSPEEALKISAQKASDSARIHTSRYFGCLKNSKAFSGDPLEIQQELRAEWDRN
ncbi:MAG: DUF2281 domain-containing protein [Spirochaetaceae bacterium]|nr:DUF2281 domain-containing protein [Spirochaetaceae bacterium]